MKVGFISHWFDPEGGAAAGPGTIARALVERGHDVHVVTGYPIYPEGRVFPGYSMRPYFKGQMDGMTVHRFPIYPSHDSSALRRFGNYASYALSAAIGAPFVLPRLDCAFVYSTPASAALPALAMRAFRQLPYLVQVQDLWPQTITASDMMSETASTIVNGLLNPFCDLVYRAAHRVCVTSPGMASFIEQRGIRANKIEFVPNWADESSFRPAPRNPDLAAELGLTAGTVIMYAGNLGRMQNLDVVVAAADQLRNMADLQFALVGAGVMMEELRAEVRRRQLTNVVFVPAQPFRRMSSILALGDAQLVTLKDEPLFRSTLPSKLQANLAAGRPVIGAVAGDAARVIQQSGAGLVARPGSADDLAAAVRAFCAADEQLRSLMRERARQFYLDNFSKTHVVSKIESLLDGACQSRRGLA